ncbi:MAG: hypothetical protein ACOY94_15400 [Bacillota bacterium]
MNRIERVIYVVVALLLAALCLFLLTRLDAERTARDAMEAELQVDLSKTRAEVLEREQEVADLKGALLAAKAGRPAPAGGPHTLLNAADLRVLREAGLADPVADLVQALQARPDLIPTPPVLGGKMTFEEPKNWVLSRPWILASYNDGHVGGRALFRYSVAEGKVEFTLVESVDW